MRGELIFQAVGDVAVERPNPASIFDHCRASFVEGQILFGQLETPVSTRGAPAPHPTLAVRSHPDGLRAAREAGFNVMSFAGNHCLDWGVEAFFDTIEHAQEMGIALCGVGANLHESRRPAIVEHNGTKVAVLAYSSILPEGYWADNGRPGCTPLRAHTLYEQSERDQPGTPPVIRTFAHSGDLANLLEDIRLARARSDLVVLSMHWGIHFVEGEIADYQREIAYAAIDAGASMILGHHPHILKGVEIYRDCPIFYSMGNFAIEQPTTWDTKLRDRTAYKTIHALNPSWNMDAVYTLPEETRRTIIVRCRIVGGKIVRTSFLPAFIEDGSAPHVVNAADPRFTLVTDYMRKLSEGMHVSLVVEGSEVSVLAEHQP